MPTETVLDLITATLVKIRVHRSGASVPPEDAQDATDELVRMLETWQVDGSLVYRVQDIPAPLAGQASLTIGPGGVITTVRPVGLHDGFTRLGGVDYPYAVIHKEFYDSLTLKTAGGTAPTYLYYEPAFPLGILHVWPVSSGGELHVMADQPFDVLALNDTLSFPPGYRDALVYSLGKRLASSYGQTLDALYLSDMQQALRALTIRNHRPVLATLRLPVRARGTESTWISHG